MVASVSQNLRNSFQFQFDKKGYIRYATRCITSCFSIMDKHKILEEVKQHFVSNNKETSKNPLEKKVVGVYDETYGELVDGLKKEISDTHETELKDFFTKKMINSKKEIEGLKKKRNANGDFSDDVLKNASSLAIFDFTEELAVFSTTNSI